MFRFYFFTGIIFCASMVRIQFTSNLDLYLSLYLRPKSSYNLPTFTGIAYTQLLTYHDYCGKAAIRQVDYNIFEFYFCGYKMCFDRMDHELKACLYNEHNTKWELQQVDVGRTYTLRNNDWCVTLRNKQVKMEPCHEGVDIKQIVHVIPDKEKSKFFVDDDMTTTERKRKFEENLNDNEEMFRQESLIYGKEGVRGSRSWNLDQRHRLS